MHKYIYFTLLIINSLYAQNPKPYAELGDTIYDNVDKIENLKKVGDYYLFKNDIDRYVKEVKKTKKEGFSLTKNSSPAKKREYLNKLRKLSKDNDYYIRAVNNSFKESIKDNNTTLFLQIIQSRLIDPAAYKKPIIKYYYAHSSDINKTGVIQKILSEDNELKAKEAALRKKAMNKKKREEEKIKRIRLKDKLQQEKLEKKLDEAVEKKKVQIREEQKKELIKSM